MAEEKSIQNEQAVHWAVTVRVREGKEIAFTEALTEFAKRSINYHGATGVHLIMPVPGSACREFGILRSFLSEQHSRDFYNSYMYRQYKEETAHLIEGEPVFRPISGLGIFFQSDGQQTPPRWKMAIVTYLGVVPSVFFWTSILKPFLLPYHWAIGVLVGNAAIVATLAWLMMPVLTKLFQGWLQPTCSVRKEI